MAHDPILILSLIATASAVLVATAWVKQPGIGILIALFLAVVWVGLGGWDLSLLGFQRPENWGNVLVTSLLLGVTIALAEVAILEPFGEFITGQPVDKSLVSSLRGKLRALVMWLVLVWSVVAFLEEIVVRGFLLQGMLFLSGESWMGAALAILVTSVVFGLAHWYQGASGAISTGLVSVILGGLFVASGRNLWPVILTHGFIDTAGLALIYFNLDVQIKDLMKRTGPR
jgi:uncharacterized protein